MTLNPRLHLAYCTNIHRGQTWAETFDSLRRYTLPVRDRVAPGRPYAIGLRLSAEAARALSDRQTLNPFRQWLDRENCYVFTINGFPYGAFHGAPVKERVYAPDWTTPERLEFTNLLFDLLAELTPEGLEGSVSTVPCSFKEFIQTEAQVRAMRDNLWRCVEHVAGLSARTGRNLHLGLEPEPLCYLETSEETVQFLERMRADRPGDERSEDHLGVNYDACHLAVEFEEPGEAVRRFQEHRVKISKIHLSSALKVIPTPAVRRALRQFADDTYFHQVIARAPDGSLTRYRDLDVALDTPGPGSNAGDDAEAIQSRLPEWRVHFHIPLHSRPTEWYDNTSDHLLGLLEILRVQPDLCHHLEMETYTWEVMPREMKNRSVVDQLAAEYEWTLERWGETEEVEG
jgi:hypothetical protein